MSDLQRRADNLEKEAGDLRRENGWLKEMVIMKGRRRAGLNVGNRQGDGKEGQPTDGDESEDSDDSAAD